MRQDLSIGSLPVQRDARQQGRLEPSPMLICGFDIDICGPAESFVLPENCFMTNSGIDPDIKRVVATRQSRRNIENCRQLSIGELIPGVRPAFFHQLRESTYPGGIQNRFTTIVKDWKGYAPASLPGNTPVRPGFN